MEKPSKYFGTCDGCRKKEQLVVWDREIMKVYCKECAYSLQLVNQPRPLNITSKPFEYIVEKPKNNANCTKCGKWSRIEYENNETMLCYWCSKGLLVPADSTPLEVEINDLTRFSK